MFTSLHSSEPKSSAQASAPQGKATPFFQAKLTVNTPGDAHEQEADRVADQVMRMREGDAPIVQRMPLTPVSSVMRACAECEKEKMQRKETGGGDAGGKTAPSVVSDVLSSGGGQPMESGTRQFMESRFGQDFSQVRIHTDSRAAESASAIQARAYTSGRDVVFGAGEYQPGSEGGRRLLAHELVHVGQQEGGIRRQEHITAPPIRSHGRLSLTTQFRGCDESQNRRVEYQLMHAKSLVARAVSDFRHEIDRQATGGGAAIITIAQSALTRAFHTNDPRHIRTIIRRFERIHLALENGERNIRCVTQRQCSAAGFGPTFYGYSYVGGMNRPLSLCPHHFEMGSFAGVINIVHECAHQAGIPGDVYFFHRRFPDLTTAQALNNADSYAECLIYLNVPGYSR